MEKHIEFISQQMEQSSDPHHQLIAHVEAYRNKERLSKYTYKTTNNVATNNVKKNTKT